jgi:beta-galactosidase
VQLAPDRANITADGRDLSVITVSIADKHGRTVPTAGNHIHFDLSGPGKIIGVGNGDPSCHEPDIYLSRPAIRSGTMNMWWLSTVSEAAEHKEVGEKFNDTRWTLTEVTGEADEFTSKKPAVFRAHLYVSEADLALTNIPVRFGTISKDGWIYVNGKLAGETHDPAVSLVVNARGYVHAGVNTIAVLVRSGGEAGGIGKGVSVELVDTPTTGDWQRSVFNGLAQMIVQSGHEAGEIKLTATADGLAPATTVIHSKSQSESHE